MTSKEIRESWLKFFESKQHLIVETKSLVPQNDPSLLWINSGVATLKDFFSGKKTPPAKRLTNSQKAIRTNDIENVGVTARHHTFFEMLGNFSIGDYFKKEAIAFAAEYLLDVLKIEKDKLYFTYYHEDLETKELWMSHGFEESHMIPGDESTNFWEVGSGPCGPNTEIFYDRGSKYDQRGIELLQNDIENDRYIEIWNIVFSTYNSDGEGNYTELVQKNIDTGAGLERIVSMLQDAPTNFDTDLFMPIISEIEKYTDFRYDGSNYFKKDPSQEAINSKFKVIADHMRAVANAVADGAQPSNVGRGYILRRLIRRSAYTAMSLQVKQPIFLYKLVEVIKSTLPFEYDVKVVQDIIKAEEETFAKTVDKGRELLEEYITPDLKQFPGDVAFKLSETYGFPIELTTEILAEKNLSVNLDEFNSAKEEHANRSRGKQVSGMDKVINSLSLLTSKIDHFVGYDTLENTTQILEMFDRENRIESATNEEYSYLVLKETPFYATNGGQKHDRGYILQNDQRIEIIDVFKDKHGNHIHKVLGNVSKDQEVSCHVDATIRLGLERNHSGTHLMFCALRKVLGPQIVQLGSDNNEERLTFDLPADTKPTDEQIRAIENEVRSYIKRDVKREYLQMTTDEAKAINAIMTLDEAEYMNPKNVRIVRFDGITADLCGGTHLSNSGKLENFKITNVEKKAAGVYRIRAISSNTIVEAYLKEVQEQLLEELNKNIEKNQKIDANYKLDYELNSDLELANDKLKDLIEKTHDDGRVLLKKAQEASANNYDVIVDQVINDQNVLLVKVDSAQAVKTVVANLREENAQNVVICFDQASGMVAVASKFADSNAIAQKIFGLLEGRGGGNKILSMGKVAHISQIFDILDKVL
ncbi:alanine--tRNA ligase [Mycoplasma sp. Ms02]|uniref:alanine--tRNA ligase n=1 Tax=Mycoplasma sp. Ms02 TaxID=353851 RepID=UPI001C8A0CBA|nr:alanine--tRNA ligase [Mycoplasma sp. Ms02]QZE12474.1 alanine--tRNA ligase [Mycoplasma sp. Ms02]